MARDRVPNDSADRRDQELFVWVNADEPQYRALSPEASYPIAVASRSYASAEHYLRASMALSDEAHQRLRAAPSLASLRDDAASLEIREDWPRFRVRAMFRALEAKTSQYPEIASLLLSTKDTDLRSGWDDLFWGWCDGLGTNMVGRLLQEIRSRLRDSSRTFSDPVVKSFLNTTVTNDYSAAVDFHEILLEGQPIFVHMTREREWRSASEALSAILGLRRVDPSPRPVGTQASCWTLTSVSEVLRTHAEMARLRRQIGAFMRPGFGLGIPYRYGREVGMMPAIPWSPSDVEDLPVEARYRIQFYSPRDERDWTHDREWRLSGSIEFRPDLVTVFLPSGYNLGISLDEFAEIVQLPDIG